MGEEFKSKYGFNCPVGVRGRNSDNKLFKKEIGWEVSQSLFDGMNSTFNWINEQVNSKQVTKNKKFNFDFYYYS